MPENSAPGERLRVEFRGGQARYVAGETLRGTVVIADRSLLDCKLVVSLCWSTIGRGDRDSGTGPVWSADLRDLELEREGCPFEMVCPELPFTYEGKLLSVRWEAVAKLTRGSRAEAEASARFQLGPAHLG